MLVDVDAIENTCILMPENKIEAFLYEAIANSGDNSSLYAYTRTLVRHLASSRRISASKHEVSRARGIANAWCEKGEVRKATMLVCAALIAACEQTWPQETEYAMGTLCNCSVKMNGPEELLSLLEFVGQLQEKFDLTYRENTKLATCALLAQLKEKIAVANDLDRDLLEQVVEHVEEAYLIATSIGAPAQQIATLSLMYGRTVTLLVSPLEFPDENRISKAVRRLEQCVVFFEGSSNSALRSDAYKRLADLSIIRILTIERLLEEPALNKTDREEYENVVITEREFAIDSLRTAIEAIPQSHARAKMMVADLSESLARNLFTWSSRTPVHASARRMEAKDCAQMASELFSDLQLTPRFLNAKLLLTEIRDSRFSHDEENNWGEIIASYSGVIIAAGIRNDSMLSWIANTNLVRFIVTNAEKSKRVLDWNVVDKHIGNAFHALNEIALKNDNRAQLLLRQGYHWFDEIAFASVQHTKNYDRIPQIYEIRRRLNSKITNCKSLTTCNAIRNKLSPKDAVVFINRGPNETQAFAVHRGAASSMDLVCRTLTWESFRLKIDPWISSKEYERNGIGDSSTTDKALHAMLRDLYEILWKDLDCRLKKLGVERIFLILGKGLRIVPFHALRDNAETHLIDVYQFIYAISPSHIGSPSISGSPDANFLGVSNPTIDLEFSEAEVSIVAQTLNTSNCVILKRNAANKAALLAEIQKADVIHFACHGSYELELRGTVVYGKGMLNLADSKLDLEEIRDLGLPRSPMVVLSACETGKTNWHDSVPNGIGDTFILSGAKAVVSTLWSVNDFATSLLMMEMYSHLENGVSIPVALRCSQFWLRDLSALQAKKLLSSLTGVDATLPPKPFESPRYWAPFLLTIGLDDQLNSPQIG